jgi:uncharacterized protein (TIGR03083 family)
MDRASHLARLAADAELLVDEASAGLDRPVPTCPGWTCERLVGHVGRVYRWTAGWIATGASADVERPPAGPAVAGWAREGLAELLATFASAPDADPGARVSTWAGEQPAAFWPRRMALETAVHRVDAQRAGDAVTPVDTALAVEGVDELLTVLLPWRGTAGLGGEGETIHLHATDPDIDEVGGGEWLLTLGPDALAVERAHAKGDVAVRGPASDLFLLLWNRVGTDGLQVFGDAGLLDRWREAVRM